MTKFPHNNILVFDIEASSTNTEEAQLRYFCAYSYSTQMRYHLFGNQIEEIKKLIENHQTIVGFNIKKYDMPILNRHGVYFQYKTVVDLWEVLADPRIDVKTHTRSGGKGRGAYMGLKLNSWSMANIAKALELGEYKTEGFDYNIFKRSHTEWTKEELELVTLYANQDITVTKKLFEYTNNFYYPFVEYISEKNFKRFAYITSSIASLAYKIICHMANLEEIYGENSEDRQSYAGGFVFMPKKEEHVGTIICFDFNSLYPSIYRGFNLLSPAKEDSDLTFNGNSMFSIKGTYDVSTSGPVEKVIAQLYQHRKKYKAESDKREYLIKIIINSIYGITANPAFAQVFSKYSAPDCTAVGRQMIQYAANFFNERGFEMLYGDTDSCYIALHDKTVDEALATAKELTNLFKANMPLPHDDFNFGLDAIIDAMWFFPYEDGEVRKKNYAYIKQTKKGPQFVIKGLPIIKSNASKVATKILHTHLIPNILDNKKIKFNRGNIQQWIYFELEKDLSLVAQTYKIKDAEEYDNEGSLHYQILQKYGSGTHELLPNTKIGVGKGKHYCTIKEFTDSKLSVRDIDLTVCWNNLAPFILNEQTSLGDF